VTLRATCASSSKTSRGDLAAGAGAVGVDDRVQAPAGSGVADGDGARYSSTVRTQGVVTNA
jgi:hypothetical protein